MSKKTPEEEVIGLLRTIEYCANVENTIDPEPAPSRWIRSEALYGNVRLATTGRGKELQGVVNRAIKAGIIYKRKTQFGDFLVMTRSGKKIAEVD